MSLKFSRLSTALGAEISDVDLSQVSDLQVKEIKKHLNENMVLFFPNQKITIDEHVEFGSKFGELEGHPNLKKNNVHPKVFELTASEGGIADEWHTDITFQDSPALMSVLHMVKCPDLGGDTMWSNLSAAYEALSDPLKDPFVKALPHYMKQNLTAGLKKRLYILL
jgi:Probable taurine catabolism dioxygenase